MLQSSFLAFTIIFILSIFCFPVLAQAQPTTGGNFGGLNDVALQLLNLIRTLIVVVFALGLLFFLWGLARFIASAGNPQAKQAAKDIMVWGVIALAVMASVWGLVRLLQSTFLSGLPVTTITLPTVPGF